MELDSTRKCKAPKVRPTQSGDGLTFTGRKTKVAGGGKRDTRNDEEITMQLGRIRSYINQQDGILGPAAATGNGDGDHLNPTSTKQSNPSLVHENKKKISSKDQLERELVKFWSRDADATTDNPEEEIDGTDLLEPKIVFQPRPLIPREHTPKSEPEEDTSKPPEESPTDRLHKFLDGLKNTPIGVQVSVELEVDPEVLSAIEKSYDRRIYGKKSRRQKSEEEEEEEEEEDDDCAENVDRDDQKYQGKGGDEKPRQGDTKKQMPNVNNHDPMYFYPFLPPYDQRYNNSNANSSNNFCPPVQYMYGYPPPMPPPAPMPFVYGGAPMYNCPYPQYYWCNDYYQCPPPPGTYFDF